MKFLKIAFAVMMTLSLTAQSDNDESVINFTYYDIPADKIGRFLELHKEMSDIQLGEKRTLQGQWVYRHYYGSGASVIIQDNYASAVDAVSDDEWVHFREKWQESSEEERQKMGALAQEYVSFRDGHTDEMRVVNWQRNHKVGEGHNWDSYWIMVIGEYSLDGNWQVAGDAFNNWQTIPQVENGQMMAGGYTWHLYGSGKDLSVYSAYADMKAFADALENAPDNPEERQKFWSMVKGSHTDQIYVHVGHVKDGVYTPASE